LWRLAGALSLLCEFVKHIANTGSVDHFDRVAVGKVAGLFRAFAIVVETLLADEVLFDKTVNDFVARPAPRAQSSQKSPSWWMWIVPSAAWHFLHSMMRAWWLC